MTDNDVADTQPTASVRTEQDDVRSKLVFGAVTKDERDEVDAAFEDRFPFRSHSQGTRAVMLIFARLPEMRDLVRANLHLAY